MEILILDDEGSFPTYLTDVLGAVLDFYVLQVLDDGHVDTLNAKSTERDVWKLRRRDIELVEGKIGR